MTKVRWGILSTAEIAQKALIPAIQRSTIAVVTAIATGSGIEKANEVAARFNIEKTYDSYEKLLADPDIDAVYIPLPNYLHKKWVIEAAKWASIFYVRNQQPLMLRNSVKWRRFVKSGVFYF